MAGPSATSPPWPLNSHQHDRQAFWDAVQSQADQPYVWGAVGPPAAIEHQGAMVLISGTVLDDIVPNLWDSFREMLRREAIYRRSMRRLKVADPEGYDRLQYLLRLGTAARLDREEREAEARRCPTCGCDPQEHEERWE